MCFFSSTFHSLILYRLIALTLTFSRSFFFLQTCDSASLEYLSSLISSSFRVTKNKNNNKNVKNPFRLGISLLGTFPALFILSLSLTVYLFLFAGSHHSRSRCCLSHHPNVGLCVKILGKKREFTDSRRRRYLAFLPAIRDCTTLPSSHSPFLSPLSFPHILVDEFMRFVKLYNSHLMLL